MRAVLLILILFVVALLAAVATGFIDIRQTRSAQAPNIDRTENGIAARGGQAPTFDVETGSISVGARQANVTVPTVDVTPADQQPTNYIVE